MALLIHSLTLSKFKEKFPKWNEGSTTTKVEGYHGIAITDDGYLVSHGKVWNLLNNSDFSETNKNKFLVTTATGTTLTDAPAVANQIIQWNGTKFTWTSHTTYKIKINGQFTTTTLNSENNLGTIYAPTSSGTGIPSLSGTTWSYNSIISAITDETNTGIPTVQAIKNYVTAGLGNITTALTGAFQYIKDVDKDPTVTAPTAPEGGWKVGNVIGWNKKEYLYTSGGTWREFGDEGSYLLRTEKPFTSPEKTLSIGAGNIGAGITLDLATVSQNNTTPTNILSYSGTFNAITGVTVDSYGRVTGLATTTFTMPSTDEIDYSSSLLWSSGTTQVSTNPTSAQSNPYLQLIQNNDLKTYIQFGGTRGIKVSAKGNKLTIEHNNSIDAINSTGLYKIKYDAQGHITGSNTITLGTNLAWNGNTLNATNTWRPVYAWTIADLGKTNDILDNILTNSTGTKSLAFSSAFGYREKTLDGTTTKVAEIDLVWAEVAEDGTVTYI